MWDTAVVTNSGVALLSQWAQGGTLVIDGASAGDATSAVEGLANRTSLANEVADVPIVGYESVAGGVKYAVQFSAAETGYTARQIGIWGHIGSGSSTLIALYQDSGGIEVPSAAEMPDFVYAFYAIVACDNTGDLEVSVDTSAVATQAQLAAAAALLLPKADVINNLSTTDAGKALDARQGKALKELADAKLPLSGGTMTGNIDMGQASATGYARQLTWQTADGATFLLSTTNNALQITLRPSGSSAGSSALTLYSDGSVYVPAAAWRNALQITPGNIGAFGVNPITAPTDLDDTTLIGHTLVDSTQCANCPEQSYQFYIVALLGRIQFALAHSQSGATALYVRYYTNSQWYPWKKVALSAV